MQRLSCPRRGDHLIAQSVQNSICSLRPLSGYCMDTSNYVGIQINKVNCINNDISHVDNMKNQSVVSYLKEFQEAETILPTSWRPFDIAQSVQNCFCSLKPLSGYCMDKSNYVDIQ